MSKLLDLVLTATPRGPTAWWSSTLEVRTPWPVSIDRAIALGAHADRLGHAFLGGYTSAVTALDPSLGPDELGALCATESGGGHPRAIQTSLLDGRISGTKHFITGGPLATAMLVVVKVGEKDGRPELKLVRVSGRAAGISMEQGLPLDFVPEVPHAAVTFTDTPVDAVLEGDGYERYLKPFRTIEDLHVFGAIAACLVANGKNVLPEAQIERLLGVLAAIQSLGREPPSAGSVHLALAGALETARAVIETLPVDQLEPEFAARFRRDLPLLKVAEKIRAQRRLKAWDSVRGR